MQFFREILPAIIALIVICYPNPVKACPVIDIGPDISVCEGSSATFDAGNCWALVLWNTGATTRTISVKDSGMYVVWVMDSMNNTYYDTAYLFYLPKPNMIIQPSGPVFICEGDVVKLDAGDLTILAYQWSNGETSGDIIVDSTGSFFVIGWNSLGCPDTSSLVFVGISKNPSPDLGNDTAICQGDQIILDAGPAYVKYTWSDSNATRRDTIQSALLLAVAVTDVNGCQGFDTILISVNPVPKVSLGKDTSFCFGESVLLDAGNYTQYSWSTGDSTPTIEVSQSGSYFVQVTDSNGCNNFSGIRDISVFQAAVPIVVYSDGVLSTQAGLSHTWMFDGIPLAGATSAILLPPRRGNYRVVTVDQAGCTDTSSTFLLDFVLTLSDLPEGFSPNGDGVNDRFIVPGLELFPETSLKIVDRNGSLVFHNDNYQNEWNGISDQGKELPDGTYYFALNPGIDFEGITGYIIISR